MNTNGYYYSRGTKTTDAYPSRKYASSFAEFATNILEDKAPDKGLQYFSCDYKSNGDDRLHRCKVDALPRRYIPFDFDRIADQETFHSLLMELQRFNGFVYTTASHTETAPRARAILDASREMNAEEAERICLAIEQQITKELGNSVAMDRSIYKLYQPIYTPPINTTIYHLNGETVNVDTLLLEAPPISMPQGKRERLTSIQRNDPTAFLLEEKGMIKSQRPDGGLDIICPFEQEHSTDTGGTVYFLPHTGGYEKGNFACLHEHCKEKLQAQFILAIGMNDAQVNSDEWKRELIIKTTVVNGTSISTTLPRVHNYSLILQHCDEYQGRIKYDEFRQEVTLNEQPLKDYEIISILEELEANWIYAGVEIGNVYNGIVSAARKHLFHPIKQYLESTKWDGVPRINKFFTAYCGAEETEYHHDVALSLFTSACARIYEPGCKVDTAVILEGDQGVGKTSLWPALFGREYTAEPTADLDNKDFFLNIRGKWCMDFGELTAITTSKVELNRIKQVMSQPIDTYREPYARKSMDVPRQCVFVGGTNDAEWLTDHTGNRRYYPVTVPTNGINLNKVSIDKDQLWAEALQCYKQGHKWWIVRGAAERQEQSYSDHPWEAPISQWVKSKKEFTMSDLLATCLYIVYERQTRASKTIAGGILQRLGFKKERVSIGGERTFIYRKN